MFSSISLCLISFPNGVNSLLLLIQSNPSYILKIFSPHGIESVKHMGLVDTNVLPRLSNKPVSTGVTR
jgi:hypothetical protein